MVGFLKPQIGVCYWVSTSSKSHSPRQPKLATLCRTVKKWKCMHKCNASCKHQGKHLSTALNSISTFTIYAPGAISVKSLRSSRQIGSCLFLNAVYSMALAFFKFQNYYLPACDTVKLPGQIEQNISSAHINMHVLHLTTDSSYSHFVKWWKKFDWCRILPPLKQSN